MLKNLHREIYPAGEIIFREGDSGDSAYLIEEGSVEVSVSSTQQSCIGRGELFGEIALIDQQPRTATVRALESTVLIPIPRQLVKELLEKTDPVVRHLLLTILERYRSTRSQPAFDPSQSTIFRRDTTRGVATQQLRLAHDIAEALREEQFEMFYQPICDLSSGRLAGFEALIRWHHPVEGMVSPMDFLWVAEQTGQIREIGLWTLQRACLDWPVLRTRINHHKPFVSVNLSPSQLTGDGFVGEVKTIVSDLQMPPRELKLELTETVIINNPDLALQLLSKLIEAGSTLALDDFGTGHSGLDALHRYPIGTMKIDRAFVSQMLTSPHSAKIVQASIELAHSLKMDVVAEGIESEDERLALLELGCDYGQGWLFGKPASLKNI
ncbi:EAL domain-containing protein [Sideroxydans lithotrophicus]|uniref:Diguanylate phosphodiesterase n=1 Tax=Sideroxydans lithotrophicus (strain ES-1) TaxID=580332 RepID=D5CLE0_SIDLE|nr:EAL domain-containing protein [Sideroxydans lithotrophicus]ADE10528.1 diguanylate phosphodiesterase [Sideroxydans lithotrophicus ES-1]